MADPGIAVSGGGVRFGLLGSLQVTDGSGANRQITAAKQRIVLAALLLNPGQMVPAASLIDALWETSAPPNAAVAVRTYVMRLRRALGPAGERVVHRPGGWAVELRSPAELDIAEAESLWQDARAAIGAGDWPRVSSLLARALSLWRGEPLADVASAALARRELGRLTEWRLQLTEARIDADLHLGRHQELAAELERLAAEHPLREHLRGQLMLACYRSGQQAAALQAYQDARHILAGELGVEPGPELHRLHQQILTADPALMSEPAAADVPAAGAAARDSRVPRQIPPAIRHFTGRAAALRQLSAIAQEAAADGAGAVAVIMGMPGVGKTSLAVHWAHQVAGLFPDGQLFVNLRGFDPAGAPLTPAQATGVFLDALGVAPDRVPAELDARTGLYRSLLAGKRVLVVADNARDAGQVRPLLPGSPGCMVVATSRTKLTSLVAVDGASPLALDVLDGGQGAELLARRLGSGRAADEPDAVAAIAGLCAGLPLALVIAAARAATQPGIPLARLAGELAGNHARLGALDSGDATASIQAAFSWSARQLTGRAARMLRLLALHPGPDITVPAAASLAGEPPAQARAELTELAQSHLAAEQVPGRYSMHDLLRVYAAAAAGEPRYGEERSAAIGRTLDHYLHTACVADRLAHPSRDPIELPAPQPGTQPEQLVDADQAMAWFETEHQVLLAIAAYAARSGFSRHAWQLPWSLATFLTWRAHWEDLIATQRAALAAATALGDADAQALIRRKLGFACLLRNQYDEAGAHFGQALTHCRTVGDQVSEAGLELNVSWMLERQGRHAEAVEHDERALSLYRALGHRHGQALALNAAGWHLTLHGRHQQALGYCQQALALQQQELDDRLDQADTLDSLGYIHNQLGQYGQAAGCYEQAVRLLRHAKECWRQADSLTRLGEVRLSAGDTAAAREAWQQALAILDDIHHAEADDVRAKLARLPTPAELPGACGRELRVAGAQR